MFEQKLFVEVAEKLSDVLGCNDKNLAAIKKKYDVEVVLEDISIKIRGKVEDNVAKAHTVLKIVYDKVLNNENITAQKLNKIINSVENGTETSADVGVKGIKPLTKGQKEYIRKIEENTITFGIGPAGTGKTYLAVVSAVKAFKNRDVSRIILTRPAVEAGESLGFLPGDMQAKVDLYLRPLYDALFEMFGAETFKKHVEKGVIEVAPIAYMRGRTLENAFIILDEAQNTTDEQLKMFLTRLGSGSKMVITGDTTQIDLPVSKKSGLIKAIEILQDIPDISVHRFTDVDIVRHKLVQDIVNAYAKNA
ncbi:MAG: PhoH family protein [Oscillospiraceae bacterium]|nr:PhoH family protein [Oscillospiraceae bacterium]